MNNNNFTVIAEDQFYRVEMHEKASMMYVLWKVHLEGDMLREKFSMLLKLINKFQPKTWLGNAKATYYTTVQDARWLYDEFIPSLVDSSICKYARVETANSLLLLDSLSLQDKLNSLPENKARLFTFRFFTDEEQAYKWLAG